MRVSPFALYLILFHAIWALWVLLGYPHLQQVGEATLLYAALNISVRLLLWVLPVFLYLRYIDRTDPLEYLKLRQHWQRGIGVGLACTVINFLLSLARFGVPHPHWQTVTWNSVLSTSLLIGFVEEIPYRGFILQKFEERLGFARANLLAALLFWAVHLPGWLSLHIFKGADAGFVFVFGLLLGLIFRYSQSLWGAIVTHNLNDFLSAIVFRP